MSSVESQNENIQPPLHSVSVFNKIAPEPKQISSAETAIEVKFEDISLNAEQYDAAKYHNVSKVLQAAAGTGKTRTLEGSVLNFIRDNYPKNKKRVLCITFTRMAASDLNSRLSERLTKSQMKRVWVGTFHKFAAKINSANEEKTYRLISDSDYKLRCDYLKKRYIYWWPLVARICRVNSEVQSIEEIEDLFLSSRINNIPTQVRNDRKTTPEDELDNIKYLQRTHYTPARAFLTIWGYQWLKKRDQINQNDIHSNLRKVLETHTPCSELDKLINEERDLLKISQIIFWLSVCELNEREKCRTFNDIVVSAYEALHSNQKILYKLANRYAECYVDEYQDTDTLQFRTVAKISQAISHGVTIGPKLTIVGDINQTIYQWRNAEPEKIHEIARDRKLCSLVKRLQCNYRSSEEIVALAKNMINHGGSPKCFMSSMRGKKGPVIIYCQPITKVIDLLVQKIKSQFDGGITNMKSIAVISNRHNPLKIIKEKLDILGVPSYHVTSMAKFWETGVVGEFWCFLHVLLMKDYKEYRFGVDQSLKIEKFLNSLKGIGVKTIGKINRSDEGYITLETLKEACDNKNKDKLLDKLKNIWLFLSNCWKYLDDNPTGYVDLVKMYLRSSLFSVEDIEIKAEGSIDNPNRSILIEKKTKEPKKERKVEISENKMEKIDELKKAEGLLQSIDTEKYDTLAKAIDAIIDGPAKSEENGVCLCTVWAAKGLEWKTVHLVGVGMDAAKMSQQKLLYVAFTRAKDNLYIYPGEMSDKYRERVSGFAIIEEDYQKVNQKHRKKVAPTLQQINKRIKYNSEETFF